MNETSDARKNLMNEILNRKKLGDKKFHSETSLQQFGEDEEPTSPESIGRVINETINDITKDESIDAAKRRTMSQPGPVSGSMLTATAARAARKRPPRTVMYADPGKLDYNEKTNPKFLAPYDPDAVTFGDRSSPIITYNGSYRNAPDSRSLRRVPFDPQPTRANPSGMASSLQSDEIPIPQAIDSYRLYASNNELRGAATPRKRSVVTMDAQSIRSVETHAPPPTSPEVNRQQTTKTVTITLSCIYAILLVTVGLIIYIADSFISINVSPIYSLALTSIGFLYMFYLLIDIGRYKTTALKNQKIKSEYEETIEDYFRKQEVESGNLTPGDRTPEIKSSAFIPPPALKPLNHDYCFSQGRHSGSFYLKMGAAGFALGHLVHSVLLIAVQIGYYVDETINNEDCVDEVQMALDFVNPLYVFFQLYFIFKYSNVIIMRAQGLARFAFMHFIGSSLCFWVHAIVRETILGLTLYAQSQYANGYYTSSQNENVTRTLGNVAPNNRFLDVSGLYDENCIGAVAINSIFENFSPYLYPFSVEFNILIVAVYYIIWSQIGNCDRTESDNDDDENSSITDNTICKIPSATEENDFSSNIVIYADCHASNRGLFIGLVIIVITIGMLIIGFVFSSVGEDFLEMGYLLNDCTKLFLHVAMLFAAVFAYNQITNLDINEHSISLLDDILLFICLPAFFIETTFSLVATISLQNYVKTIDFCVMVVQVIIQTALIVDGLRRCSNSRKLRRKKPGREIFMFLLIANVAMWIFHTFSYKSPESLDERYAYYGKVLWTILGHVSLPLMMFYRFHSSVCFADIWDSVYKPGSEH